MLSVKRELVFWAGGWIGRPELGAALVGLGLNPRLGVGLLISKVPRRPMLTMGASAEKYMSVAPESTMPMACMEVEFFLFVIVGL